MTMAVTYAFIYEVRNMRNPNASIEECPKGYASWALLMSNVRVENIKWN